MRAGADDPRLPSARAEAQALFGLVERGASTVRAVRELITVPPAEEERLRAFADAEPAIGHSVLAVLSFRRRVLREFERLVAGIEKRPASGTILTSEMPTNRNADVYVDAAFEPSGSVWDAVPARQWPAA